jgi:hypothetical protein
MSHNLYYVKFDIQKPSSLARFLLQCSVTRPLLKGHRGPTMKATHLQPNYAMLGAIVFSLLCWLALYAVWANLGEAGFQLLRGSGLVSWAEGVVLVALNAFGLMVLGTFAALGVSTLVATLRRDARHPGRLSDTPHAR